MAVSEFVTFTIQVNNAGLSQEGFGTPLLVSYGAAFSGVRTYNQYSDVLVDFAAGTPEANVANAVFSQSPHPTALKIGAGNLKPTKQNAIGVSSVMNSYKYGVQVDGPGITSTFASYTSDSTATTQEIHNGLLTALNAVVGKNYLAAFAPLASLTPIVFTSTHSVPELTAAAHGLNTGDGPVWVSNSGGALPTGLTASTNYWIVKIDANNFNLASSLTNALAGTLVAVTGDGTGTQTLTPQAACLSPILPFLVTGSAAGNWFSLDIGAAGSTIYTEHETETDPGIATDLTNLANIDSDWYWLLTTFNGKGIALGTAAWVEANGKAYIYQSTSTDALNNAEGGGNDTLDALFLLGYKRTCTNYHNSPLQCMAAALTSVIAPLQPGKWTAAFKTLSGVGAVNLTATQRVNLRARRAGTYTTEKGRSITWDGKVGSTVYGYLDITVGIDWLSDQVLTAAFGVLVSLAKVGYTDEDIDTIASAIRGVLHDASSDAHDLLDPGDPADPLNPPPSVTFPTVASISDATRALRTLPNGVIQGRLQGAVQLINFIATLTF